MHEALKIYRSYDMVRRILTIAEQTKHKQHILLRFLTVMHELRQLRILLTIYSISILKFTMLIL
jgi:hypothetical protein